MKLIGGYLSPFVRRVAVTMNALEMPFDHEPVRVFEQPEEVNRFNPLTRVPTLVLDDGEVLIESYAMLDALDEMAGPDRALTPSGGTGRRAVMRITAVAVGTMDKAQWAFYETRFHPAEKVHEPWIEHNDKSVKSGLGYLDELAEGAGADSWLAGNGRMTQADISATVAFGFSQAVRPQLEVGENYPSLARFAARCESLDIFKASPLPA